MHLNCDLPSAENHKSDDTPKDKCSYVDLLQGAERVWEAVPYAVIFTSIAAPNFLPLQFLLSHERTSFLTFIIHKTWICY